MSIAAPGPAGDDRRVRGFAQKFTIENNKQLDDLKEHAKRIARGEIREEEDADRFWSIVFNFSKILPAIPENLINGFTDRVKMQLLPLFVDENVDDFSEMLGELLVLDAELKKQESSPYIKRHITLVGDLLLQISSSVEALSHQGALENKDGKSPQEQIIAKLTVLAKANPEISAKFHELKARWGEGQALDEGAAEISKKEPASLDDFLASVVGATRFAALRDEAPAEDPDAKWLEGKLKKLEMIMLPSKQEVPWLSSVDTIVEAAREKELTVFGAEFNDNAVDPSISKTLSNTWQYHLDLIESLGNSGIKNWGISVNGLHTAAKDFLAYMKQRHSTSYTKPKFANEFQEYFDSDITSFRDFVALNNEEVPAPLIRFFAYVDGIKKLQKRFGAQIKLLAIKSIENIPSKEDWVQNTEGKKLLLDDDYIVGSSQYGSENSFYGVVQKTASNEYPEESKKFSPFSAIACVMSRIAQGEFDENKSVASLAKRIQPLVNFLTTNDDDTDKKKQFALRNHFELLSMPNLFVVTSENPNRGGDGSDEDITVDSPTKGKVLV